MQNFSKVVLIVDGFSTGRFLAPFLRQRGYAAIHVQSSVDIPHFFMQGFQAQDYIFHMTFDGDLLRIVDQLKSYEVLAVLVGTETGVYLGDELAAALRNILGTKNKLGILNQEVLVQSFFSLQMNVQVGDYLVPTIDYYSSPGSVHLVNQDNNCLMQDMAKLRKFESEGFILEEKSTVI